MAPDLKLELGPNPPSESPERWVSGSRANGSQWEVRHHCASVASTAVFLSSGFFFYKNEEERVTLHLFSRTYTH